ncbi:MAG: helix-turn-helix domain-containing protein [Chitinophagaceae bacterium]|jgi:transcriptional regulator with XRE-family HTH domain|nr:helix-turn-helix domain-containing protein [Chitinophagaceae bacterium]
MNAKEIIGKNIQRHREALEIKQETLANILGITASALSQIENGKSDITVTRIEQIADALQKNFYEIVSSPNQVVSIYNSPISFFNNSNTTNTDPDLLARVVELMQGLNKTLLKIGDKL